MATKTNGNGRPSWGNMAAVAAVLIAVASSFFNVFNSGTDKQFIALREKFEAGSIALSDRVGRIESDRFTGSEFRQYAKRIEDRIDRADREIKEIDQKLMPRKEIEESFKLVQNTFAERRQDITKLQDALGGSTLADLKRHQEEIDRRFIELLQSLNMNAKPAEK